MWSYKIVKNYYTTEDELNEYGSDGWELVTVSYHRLYFKKWVEPEITPMSSPIGLIAVSSTLLHPRHTYPTGTTGPTGPTGTPMDNTTIEGVVDSNRIPTGHTGPILMPGTVAEDVVAQ